jgi:hypothetical protein
MGRRAFHVDHIIPRTKAPHLILDPENLVWACLRCNGTKGEYDMAIDPVSQKVVPLFHPKRQKWFSRFRGTSDGKIHRRDAVGRGTTDRLEFNAEVSVIRHRSLGYENEWWP